MLRPLGPPQTRAAQQTMPKHAHCCVVRKMRVNWLESKCDTPLPIICLHQQRQQLFQLIHPGIDRVQKLLLMFPQSIFFQVLRRNCSSNCCSISNVDISLSAFSFNRFETSEQNGAIQFTVSAQFVGDTIATKMLEILRQSAASCGGVARDVPSIDLNSSLRISTLERRVLPFSLWVSSQGNLPTVPHYNAGENPDLNHSGN